MHVTSKTNSHNKEPTSVVFSEEVEISLKATRTTTATITTTTGHERPK